MKYLILFFLCFPAFACQSLYKEGLNKQQIAVLHKAYSYGHPHSYGYTMAAIAWQESNAGMYLLNLQDPSVGVFHVNVSKVVAHLGFKDTAFNRNKAAQVGMKDFNVSANIALEELKYWNINRKRTWLESVASYNAGNNYKNGLDYADSIVSKVLVIKLCEWK